MINKINCVKIDNDDLDFFEDLMISNIKDIEGMKDQEIEDIMNAIAELLGYEEKKSGSGTAKAKLLRKIKIKALK
jgi:hypothetical protein